MTWFTLRYIPLGQITSVGILNGIIHTIMYSYYLLTAITPDNRKLVWWKKYLTQAQMVIKLIFVKFKSRING